MHLCKPLRTARSPKPHRWRSDRRRRCPAAQTSHRHDPVLTRSVFWLWENLTALPLRASLPVTTTGQSELWRRRFAVTPVWWDAFVLALTHPGSPLCFCSPRWASGPGGWRLPRPRRPRQPPRSTPARPSPPQRSGHYRPATRLWRAGWGLGRAAPVTGWSPAGGQANSFKSISDFIWYFPISNLIVFGAALILKQGDAFPVQNPVMTFSLTNKRIESY